eukprot:1115302-Amorphochlora_amoeboformis.AAC.1
MCTQKQPDRNITHHHSLKLKSCAHATCRGFTSWRRMYARILFRPAASLTSRLDTESNSLRGGVSSTTNHKGRQNMATAYCDPTIRTPSFPRNQPTKQRPKFNYLGSALRTYMDVTCISASFHPL